MVLSTEPQRRLYTMNLQSEPIQSMSPNMFSRTTYRGIVYFPFDVAGRKIRFLCVHLTNTTVYNDRVAAATSTHC